MQNNSLLCKYNSIIQYGVIMVIKINKAICSKCNKKQSVKGFYEQRCKYCGSISLFIGNVVNKLSQADMDSMEAISQALIDFHAEELNKE